MSLEKVLTLISVAFVAAACSKADNDATDMGNEDDSAFADAAGLDVSVSDDADNPDMGRPPDAATDANADAADISVTPEDPATISGTRLRRMYVAPGPMSPAQMSLGFWDSELEFACTFRAGVAGTTLCLPPADAMNIVVYADANCTQPVVQQSIECDVGWGRDPYDEAMFRATDTPANVGQAYARTDAGCSALAGVDPTATLWVGEPTPPTDFVSGSVVDAPSVAGMIVRTAEGSDGSRWVVEVVAEEFGHTCVFDAQQRCLPTGQFGGTVRFSDPTCSQRIVGVVGAPPILTTRLTSPRQCATIETHYARGPEAELPQVLGMDVVYEDQPGGCTATAPNPDLSYYELGAELAPDTFPRAVLHSEGGTPLEAVRRVTSAGEPLDGVHEFQDIAHAEACDPVELFDGNVVCLSRDRGAVVDFGYFRDPSCMQAYGQLGLSPCNDEVPRLIAGPVTASCALPGAQRLRRIAETGQVVNVAYSNLGVCSVVSLAGLDAIFELGPDATADLPALELFVEQP